MPSKSVNVSVKSLNCTQPLSDAQCQSIAKNGICSGDPQEEFLYSPSAVSANADRGKDIPVEVPTLNIDIPGLNFSSNVIEQGGYIETPFFAQYISAAYKLLISISAIAAAVMIVYGGFLYIFGAVSGKSAHGKTIIVNAVVGLVLVLGAYTILSAINPELTSLQALKITTIKPVDEEWFADHGTGDPIDSAPASEHAMNDAISGKSSSPGTITNSQNASSNPSSGSSPSTPPNPTTGSANASTPTGPITKIDISTIPFDRSLGGPANLNNYCTPVSEAKKAKTYDEKIALLVKAVLGAYKTCVQNGLCVYCQTCYTSIPNGQISGNAAPNFIVTGCIKRGIEGCYPEALWGPKGISSCTDAWYKEGKFAKGFGPATVNTMPECAASAAAAYKKYFIDKFAENKLFGADCGSFAMRLYRCANADFTSPPTEDAYDPRTHKTVKTPYLSGKSIGKFDNLPGSILGAHMNEDLLGLAAKKGGMKFGDLVYTCCGGNKDTYSAHWFMYTGGRPDVPFSFIEMGGGNGANVPGLGQISGVDVKPKNWTILDYIKANTTPQQLISKKTGKVLLTIPPKTDPAKGLIFVWRPYAE